MKKNLPSTGQKTLQLKKTSIAHLTLTNRQMRLVHGGAYAETEPTLSDALNDPNPCTTIPIPTICSRGLATK
jgi:hypothetical protein